MIKKLFYSLLIGSALIAVVPVLARQDAKPEAPKVATADTVKPKTVAIKSEADQYHIQLLNSNFALNIEKINTLNKQQDEFRQEASTLIQKMAKDAGVNLDEYELNPSNPPQFVLIQKP